MADTMQFDLVSPVRPLASMQAEAVQIPGAEGQLTAMPQHAPMITSLRPGIVRVRGEGGSHEYAVTGGFAEIVGERVTVLADRAFERTSDNREAVEAELESARKAAEEANRSQQDAADLFVSDLTQLLSRMA